jgi:hypothetical protein
MPYGPVSLGKGEVHGKRVAGFQAFDFRNNAHATRCLGHAML